MKTPSFGLVALFVFSLTNAPAPAADLPHEPPNVRLFASLFSPDFTSESGAVLTDLRLPSATAAGGAVFRAGAGGQWGVYLNSGELPLIELARGGGQAPGTPDGTLFSVLNHLIGTASGQAAFVGIVSGPDVSSANNHGIWVANQAGEVRKVARAGDPIPMLGEQVFFDLIINTHFIAGDIDASSRVYQFTANSAGEVAFYATLRGPGTGDPNDRAMFLGGASGLRVLARRGDPAPGAKNGASFAGFLGNRFAPSLNERGEVAFAAGLEGTLQPQGLFIHRGQVGLALIALTGDPAPVEGNVRFSAFGDPQLNNAGTSTFVAYLDGEGVDASNDVALFKGNPEKLEMVAREGVAAPGVDGYFDRFDYMDFESGPPVINGAGQVAFFGRLTGSNITELNDSGLWAQDKEGNLMLIAREGDPAPGGGSFRDFTPFTGVDPNLQLNARGQVAFYDGSGIWATTLAGELKLIARQGEVLRYQTTAGEQSMQIRSLVLARNSGGQDGWPSALTDRGEVVFQGSDAQRRPSIFVSYAVAVPEPESRQSVFVGLVICLCVVLRRGSIRGPGL